jgi:hypothetical protein
VNMVRVDVIDLKPNHGSCSAESHICLATGKASLHYRVNCHTLRFVDCWLPCKAKWDLR